MNEDLAKFLILADAEGGMLRAECNTKDRKAEDLIRPSEGPEALRLQGYFNNIWAISSQRSHAAIEKLEELLRKSEYGPDM